MTTTEVLPALPALFSSKTKGEVAVMDDHIEYATKLEMVLVKQENLIIDFTSLKTCLDPSGASDSIMPVCDQQEQQQAFDFEAYVFELFDKEPEKLSSLQTLSVRKLPPLTDKSTDDEHDRYSRFCYGLMQLTTLTELDLSGNPIPSEMQINLQLWNLQNLKKLSLDKTSLTALPASVGRLRKLEVLSLSNNSLKTLPITLGFCENLEVLNLQNNNFRHIPAVVLKLTSLKELKRLHNPLTERYNMQGPKYIIKHTQEPASKSKNEKQIFNPRTLQTICTKSVFAAKTDYWKHACLGPLQCKILDKLAVEMDICDNCGTVVFRQDVTTDGYCMARQYEYSVAVLLVTFCSLSGVPFLICACSKDCQNAIATKFGETNIELQKQLDVEYELMIKQAIKDANNSDLDISLNELEYEPSKFTPRLPYGYGSSDYRFPGQRKHRRHRKKCSIM